MALVNFIISVLLFFVAGGSFIAFPIKADNHIGKLSKYETARKLELATAKLAITIFQVVAKRQRLLLCKKGEKKDLEDVFYNVIEPLGWITWTNVGEYIVGEIESISDRHTATPCESATLREYDGEKFKTLIGQFYFSLSSLCDVVKYGKCLYLTEKIKIHSTKMADFGPFVPPQAECNNLSRQYSETYETLLKCVKLPEKLRKSCFSILGLFGTWIDNYEQCLSKHNLPKDASEYVGVSNMRIFYRKIIDQYCAIIRQHKDRKKVCP